MVLLLWNFYCIVYWFVRLFVFLVFPRFFSGYFVAS